MEKKNEVLEIIKELEQIIMLEYNISLSKIDTPEQIKLKEKINKMAWDQLTNTVNNNNKKKNT